MSEFGKRFDDALDKHITREEDEECNCELFVNMDNEVEFAYVCKKHKHMLRKGRLIFEEVEE